MSAVIDGLKKGENFILWPAGRIQRGGVEVIGGVRAVTEILRAVPEAKVALVRTTGLWGSMFSFAATGKQPALTRVLFSGLGVILANLLFFAPRRRVDVTLEMLDRSQLPELQREKINPWFENWYNSRGQSQPIFVPYHFFFGRRQFEFPKPDSLGEVDESKIKPETKEAVNHLIADKLHRPLTEPEQKAEITLDQLGLDSLDRMDVMLQAEQQFGFSGEEVPTSLGQIWALAQGLVEKATPKAPPTAWFQPSTDDTPPEIKGETIAAAFVTRALASRQDVAATDDLAGAMTYERLLVGGLLMAKRFAKIQAPNVGLMLPASVACDVALVGLYLAGKLPVVLNWTTGPANLGHAAKIMKLSHFVSSRAFIDRTAITVEGTEYLYLEEIRKGLGMSGIHPPAGGRYPDGMSTPANAVTTIFDYHDQTKHHFQQYARSAGYLDWANQPHAFREYSGTERIELARDIEPPPIAYRNLFEPGFMPPHPVDRRSVSLLLRYSLAFSAWKQAGASRWALRVNPSSGNLHPTEGYLVGESLAEPQRPTLYHYTSETHALERRAVFTTAVWGSLTADLPAGSFLVGLTSILWREAWKYGERAFRYCQHDVGHALAALRFSAGMLGWQLRLVTAWSGADMGRLLGTDRHDDFRAEEQEEPELLAVIMPHRGELKVIDLPPSEQTLTAIRDSEWFGRANQLSAEYVDWPLIAAAATATRTPRGRTVAEPSPETALPKGVVTKRNEPPDDVEAHDIIFQRRSAVSLDGTSYISLDKFLAMLTRTIPGRHPPWDALSWPAAIDLVLFVHRVEGLASGLYVLVRDARRRDTLQRAMRESFAWQRPTEAHAELPLYLLRAADCRDAAEKLSCHQEIAADGFFSLGMLADFDGPLHRHGGWFYRQLFWEAGVVGQVLYLEAEAWGARATGIGCYFDDPVHELLGLRDHQFQSLYHFTVGVPVDDLRLQTWPPYGARESRI